MVFGFNIYTHSLICDTENEEAMINSACIRKCTDYKHQIKV